MPITNDNAVLILGAGASAQFNLPIGGDLLAEIRNNIADEISETRNDILDYNPSYALKAFYNSGSHQPRPSSYQFTPIFATYLSIKSPDFRASGNDIQEILEEAKTAVKYLTGQTADTIDAFIAENPSVSLIVKIAIANIFFDRLYSRSKTSTIPSWALNPLTDRMLGEEEKAERNWVHLLINLARHAYKNEWVSEQNKLKIITFNYDTVLETILDTAFSNTELDLPDWTELIEIKHMHGCMPRLAPEVSNPFKTTAEMATAIEVATEPDPRAEVVADREIAKTWVEASTQIYACGFAFAGPNCRLLGLDRDIALLPPGERYIKFCNYDGNPGITNSASRYGVFDPNKQVGHAGLRKLLIESRPNPGDKLSITNWFYRGVPGELPA